jgi:uncharacterized tellurite resistance protein B-like protein
MDTKSTNRIFKGNFGELQLFIQGDLATGSYQENGKLEGAFTNNSFRGQWVNNGQSGLIEFSINDGRLIGSWKKGTDHGPMRGKWEGTEISSNLQGNEHKSEWHILHDISTFLIFFANLSENGMQDQERAYFLEAIQNWNFEIDGVRYGVSAQRPADLREFTNEVFQALYMERGEPTKDPFIQLNHSHENLCKYYNRGDIFNCKSIKAFLTCCLSICTQRNLNELQAQQLEWYIEQWKEVCPDVVSLNAYIEAIKEKKAVEDELKELGLNINDLYMEQEKSTHQVVNQQKSERNIQRPSKHTFGHDLAFLYLSLVILTNGQLTQEEIHVICNKLIDWVDDPDNYDMETTLNETINWKESCGSEINIELNNCIERIATNLSKEHRVYVMRDMWAIIKADNKQTELEVEFFLKVAKQLEVELYNI